MRPLTPVLYNYGTASPLPALPLALFGSDAAPSLSAAGNAEPPPGHQPPGPAPPSVPTARGQAVTGQTGRPAGHAPFNQGGPSHARLPTTAPPDIAASRSAQLDPRAASAPEQPIHPWGAPQQYEWQRQTAATAPQRPAETPAQQWSQTTGHASGAPTRQHSVPDTARHPNHPIGITDAVQPIGCHEGHQPEANYTQADRSRRRRRRSTSARHRHAPGHRRQPATAAQATTARKHGYTGVVSEVAAVAPPHDADASEPGGRPVSPATPVTVDHAARRPGPTATAQQNTRDAAPESAPATVPRHTDAERCSESIQRTLTRLIRKSPSTRSLPSPMYLQLPTCRRRPRRWACRPCPDSQQNTRGSAATL